jgi:tetratricopeptide (TPR) repeat protein
MDSKASMGNSGNPHGCSDRSKSLEQQGWKLLEKGSWSEAFAKFDELLHIDPANVGALQGGIASLRKERRFPEAAELLSEALRKRPDSAGILAERVWLNVDQRRYDDAVLALDEVFRHSTAKEALSPEREALLAWKVSLLRTRQRFDEAHTAVREALKAFPQSPQLLIQLAWLHFHQNHLDEAAGTFAEVLRLDERNEGAFQGEIATLRLKRLFAEARRKAQSALKMFPASAGIRSELGWVSFACEEFDEAERIFRDVQVLIPDDPYCRINLAWVLLKEAGKESLIEASIQCQNALDLEPNLSEALGCLGVVAFRQGHIQEAENYLLRSIAADPAHGQYADLGALYVHIGRFEDAQEILEKGVAVKPQEAALHLELGNLYAQKEEPRKAILEFRQAIVLDPASPDFPQALAISLLVNDKAMEAESVLRHAIRNLDEFKRWKLHLVLSQVLTQLAEDTSDPTLMGEALKEVNTALRLMSAQADPHFYDGIVRFKMDDFSGSLRAFRRCNEIDPSRIEAEINAKRVQALIREDKTRSKASLVASMIVGITALCQLGGLWFLRLQGGDKSVVTPVMITVLVPVCLGLLVVSVLLPSLTKLKLTGLEAELSEPKPKAVVAGPKGQINFGRGASAPEGL